MTASAILVLDDDADVAKAARLALSRAAAVVDGAAGPDRIEDQLAECSYEAVLLDMNFAPGDRSGAAGLACLERIRTADPRLSVVLMTTFGGVKLAVEGLKRGAVDFVLKPWRNEALVETLSAAAALTRSRRASDVELNLEELEKRAVEKALATYGGNVSQAAAALGLTRPALYRRMERHGL